MKRIGHCCMLWVLVAGTTSRASAQEGEEPSTIKPAPPPPTRPEPSFEPGPARAVAPPVTEADPPEKPAPPPESQKPPPPPIRLPFVFNSVTGRILPGASFYLGGGVDTSGGISTTFEAGLGDVAQFGISLTDAVRGRVAGGAAQRLSPYGTASFKMGVAENRLFKYQPAVALGFRKSFEHNEDGHATRFAELYLVFSKDLGSRVTIHLGASLWDAAIITNSVEVKLNTSGVPHQLTGFGGIEITPFQKAHIMLELLWTPEFQYGVMGDNTKPDQIGLNATLAWGVRYEIASWFNLLAGVRLPQIDHANLLDAQIFVRVELTNRTLRRWIGLE